MARSIHVLPPDAPDEAVLAKAVSEDRILITCDSDFGELVFLKGHEPPPAIVYVRFEPQNVDDVIPRVLAALGSGRIGGHMVVIGTVGDRLTPFPA